MMTMSPLPAASPTPNPVPPGLFPPPEPGIDFGIGGFIADQINTWFANLAARAITPLLDALAVSLLATPDVADHPRIQDLWRAMSVLANGGFGLLVLLAGLLVMGHETIQTRYALKEIAPRLVVAFLGANSSFFLTTQAIALANALSRAVLGARFDAERAANAIRRLIILPDGAEIFLVLLTLVAIVLLVLLLITFIVRASLTSLLVIASPLALACLALPQLDGLARL
ncbi:hypothetical protein HII36_38530 [Nonomuraea sp. NN258]|uniref:hypothetical protein n=1 Tax=Nonomuraea antri TaxID=2730852 RepID=UPI001568749E|nr:hypothetical protein [Nonomuraea antri]NRQ37685.1 hypothetical protein [Nonomuraea antri]